MRVISCERVRCSAAARLRSDSFSSLGTYAPMKTPLRFAILWTPLLLKDGYGKPAVYVMKRTCKPNFVTAVSSGNHSSGLCVTAAAQAIYPEMPLRFHETLDGSSNNISLFDLAPRGVCLAALVTKRAGELLPHHFTHHHRSGWSTFCCTCRRRTLARRPEVIRLAALWCSDFPLKL